MLFQPGGNAVDDRPHPGQIDGHDDPSRAGGSIRSRFRRASGSSRTWSTCRSLLHTFAASHSAALSAFVTEHSPNPEYRRSARSS